MTGQIEDVIVLCCLKFDCHPKQFLGRRRFANLAQARKAAIYILTDFMHLPQWKVSQIVKREHSSVCVAYQQVVSWQQTKHPDFLPIKQLGEQFQRLYGKSN